MLGTMLAELVGSDIVYSFIEAFFQVYSEAQQCARPWRWVRGWCGESTAQSCFLVSKIGIIIYFIESFDAESVDIWSTKAPNKW